MPIKKQLLKNRLKKSRPDPESESDDFETMSESEEVETPTDDSEDSDSSYVPPPRRTKNQRKKRIVESESELDDEEEDDDEEDEEDEDDDEDEEDDDEEDELDDAELKKFISSIFPSKYMTERAKKAGLDKKKRSVPEKKKKSAKKSDKRPESKKQRRHRKAEESEDESDADDEDESDADDEDDKKEENVFSFVFSVDPDGGDEEEYNEEEDDAECNSEDEETFMKETYTKLPVPESVKDTSDIKNKDKDKKKKSTTTTTETKAKNKSNDSREDTNIEQEYLDLVQSKKQLTELLVKQPKSKILRQAVEKCRASIKKLVKKGRAKNTKSYHKLIHGDTKPENEMDYFRKKLSNKEQLRMMGDLKEINSFIHVDKPYRISLLDSKMPNKFKAIALQKLNVLRSMEPGDPEYYKIKNWVDTFMRIPFGIYKSLSVNMTDGLDVCHDFMANAKATLDSCVYGLDDAKMQIMQMMGQWIANPGALGSAIAIKGPMGTGKTTLTKEGISKILGREFVFIALGGTGDASFLEGHSYTYEGSSWGKIVQILIESKCMNPVIYFDELDKVSDTPRGEEIIGILTHLTDTSQNSQFHDKYFSEVDFDLSKCLFIFSYNDESKVNPILRDRMYRIQTKGYDAKEKVVIARNYLLPKIREQVNFQEADVVISDDIIQYIVSNKSMTKEEDGVRNLKRCLEIIHTKLNLFRLVKPEANLFGKNIEMEVSFPFTVTRKDVDIMIKNDEAMNHSVLAMYV